ncbi:MAG: energy-coupling factor ABC transporter ATP-binding protein [Chloroflexi bacterium]|nr:energy-coupling factor ABC transporter ATP-binding protein [Chloroflexota bacterium]
MGIDIQSVIMRLIDVSYSYAGRYPALMDVNLSIGDGEQVVILGANGSGKSTLLKIMDGLIRPDSGRLEAFDEDVTTIVDDPARSRDLHRRVGLVFQDPDVQLFSPTVWDDVAFGPLQMGWPPEDVRRHVSEALETMEITHLAQRAPYELSGGEKKRAAIATALSLDPDVLLLDEPTASLDPRSKAVLVDLIARLGQEKKTIVTATQELEIVEAVGSRAIVFGDSEHHPIADGLVWEILQDTELLLSANLIHEHLHYHGPIRHIHRHETAGGHHS